MPFPLVLFPMSTCSQPAHPSKKPVSTWPLMLQCLLEQLMSYLHTTSPNEEHFVLWPVSLKQDNLS